MLVGRGGLVLVDECGSVLVGGLLCRLVTMGWCGLVAVGCSLRVGRYGLVVVGRSLWVHRCGLIAMLVAILLVDHFVYSIVSQSLLVTSARSLCWSLWVSRCKPGHDQSVTISRPLWVSRCRLVAMSRCELIATGRSLWVSCCGFVAVGRCRSVALCWLLWIGRYESLWVVRYGLVAVGYR